MPLPVTLTYLLKMNGNPNKEYSEVNFGTIIASTPLTLLIASYIAIWSGEIKNIPWWLLRMKRPEFISKEPYSDSVVKGNQKYGGIQI